MMDGCCVTRCMAWLLASSALSFQRLHEAATVINNKVRTRPLSPWSPSNNARLSWATVVSCDSKLATLPFWLVLKFLYKCMRQSLRSLFNVHLDINLNCALFNPKSKSGRPTTWRMLMQTILNIIQSNNTQTPEMHNNKTVYTKFRKQHQIV